MIVSIHKANPVGEQVIADLHVQATEPFPEHGACLFPTVLHQQNAERLGEVLVKTLPGGTIDRLLIFLLEHRASVLRVAYADLPARSSEEYSVPSHQK